jgi:predicted membrane-bound spermidine synthase
MLGLVAGFLLQKNLKINSHLLWILNLLLILLIFFFFSMQIPIPVIFLLNIVFAILEGYLLSELLERKAATGEKGSTFYFLDSLGAMTGGIIFSIILIPLAGLQSSLLLLTAIIILNLIFSKMSSLL